MSNETDYPVDFTSEEARLFFQRVFPQYRDRSLRVLRLIPQDKSLSSFDGFNKRLKLSCGLKLIFADELNIKNKDVRECYSLMYKITDRWYAFEHLLGICEKVIPRSSPSKTAPFSEATIVDIGLLRVSDLFARLAEDRVLADAKSRQVLYPLLAYLINNTKGGTQAALRFTSGKVKSKKPWDLQDLFALAYGLRNLYVHHGAMAALGTKDYRVKRRLYEIILDGMTIASFQLGSEYCQKILDSLDIGDGCEQAVEQALAP